MAHREDRARPPAGDDDGTPAACAAARREIASFLGAVREARRPGADEPLRAHLRDCPACMATYREAVTSAARLGRSYREAHEDRTRTRIHVGLRERARAATRDGRRPNRFGLRLALLPAAVALLIVLVQTRDRERSLEVHWSGGEVRAADQLMDADRPVLALRAGDWCETRGDARVELTTGDGEPCFRLAGAGTLLVIEPTERSVRLARGALEVRGAATVLTVHGVLASEPDAHARLRIEGQRFELRVLEGSVAWIDSLGERVLAAGMGVVDGSILGT